MGTVSNNVNDWEEAVNRFLEGQCPASELSPLLLRLDLPEEGREAIGDALSLVESLDQSLRPLPVPAGALPRLMGKLTAAEPGDAPLERAADNSAAAGATTDADDETALHALARGLDCAFAALVVPHGAEGRLRQALVAAEERDVTAAFLSEGHEGAEEVHGEDTVLRLSDYFRTHGHERDVLAAQTEDPSRAKPLGPSAEEADRAGGDEGPEGPGGPGGPGPEKPGRF